jgi:sulfopyruvate decarboxylase subunit beta
MMQLDACLAALAKHHRDEVVVAAYQGAFAWTRIHPHPLNCISVGAMGLASTLALGIAIGRPDKRVIVLDGDGSLIMSLSSLVTIAEAAPVNLVHIVCENGRYESNGGHPIPGRGRLSFADLARGAGYRYCAEFDDLAAFEAEIGSILAKDGPVFVTVKVASDAPPTSEFAAVHGAAARNAFTKALNEAR